MKKRKLKIAFVSFYQSDVNRGVESFVHELATRLSQIHDVTIFQRMKIKKNVLYKVETSEFAIDWEKPDSTGTRARRFYVDYWSRQIGKHTLRILPRIIRNNYDIVIPLNNGWQVLFIKLATIVSKSKLLFVGQSGLGWDDRISSYCFPNIYVALTTKQEQWLKTVNRFIKTLVIPNGVDVKRFKDTKEKLDIRLKKPLVLLVAALYDWKRVELAVKAVSKTNASLLLVGDGPEKRKLESLTNKLMPNRAQILTFPYKDIHKVYKSADLFTFPTSTAESFGIVLLEAMAAGLPVVATDDPIRREIVGDAGLFVDPTDTDAYAMAIEKTLKTKWKDKPVNQAKKFDWDIIANKYEKLFFEITK